MYSFDTDLGGYDLDLHDQTLFLTIRGVVEVELALRFIVQAKILLAQISGKSWASLVDLSDWGLHPPEVVEFLREFQQWAEDNGQITEAAVVNESVLKVMARDKLLQSRKKTVHQEYFKTKPEAEEWLRGLSLINESTKRS